VFKYLFLIVVGVAGGYFLGFQDAQVYRENILVRTVHRVGGSNREHMGTDVDKQMERVESR
jgi:hypothetical protein